jgi:hypothetical protein
MLSWTSETTRVDWCSCSVPLSNLFYISSSDATHVNFRPKRRRLVISDYVTACLEEESLLDEEGEWSNLERERSRVELLPSDFAP